MVFYLRMKERVNGIVLVCDDGLETYHTTYIYNFLPGG